jgi:TatD DNase family protein
MGLIDTHAHLAADRVLPDVDGVVARARAAGVTTIVSVATGVDDARVCLDLARRFPEVYATAGIHPHSAADYSEQTIAAIRALLDEPRVVAVGETGIDYHYDFAPRDVQRANFAAHLQLGRETGKPVIVHAREADEDVRELLREALAMGWYASFSGMVTFKNFDGEDLLRMVPADRIMVETDTPYLAPVPKRGKQNEPSFVPHTAARCAALRGEDPEEFAARTTANARRFYGIE